MRGHAPTPHADRVGTLWTRLARRTGGVPARRDLTPASLGDALPWIVLVDRIAPKVTRMRVGGAQVARILGTDPAGVPLSALVDVESRPLLSAATACLFGTPSRVTLDVSMPRSAFRAGSTGAFTLWPLAGPAGVVTRAVAVLDLLHPPTRSARLRITGWRADDAVYATLGPVLADAAESPRPFLRLVVSND